MIAALGAVIITRSDVPDAEYRALGARAEFASVGRIIPDSGGTASGVLIAPTWVITAAHVANGHDATHFTFVVDGERIRVRRSIVHPEFVRRSGFDRPPVDHALLELERPALTPPARRATTLPDSGTVATLVGFGVGGPGATDSAGTKRAAQNRVDRLGGRWAGREWPAHVHFLDFDVVGMESRNAFGPAVPEAMEGISSGGDSGGGLFVLRDGSWDLTATFSMSSVSIAGAASREFAGTVNAYIGVAAHRGWIDSVIAGSPANRTRRP
jgi:hypothetical protein